MFIRVKSKLTGHEFDVHEHQVDEAEHTLVKRYPPSKHPRRTKFRVGYKPALSVSPARAGVEGGGNVSDDS